jgi:hypothetical protein
MRTSDVRKMTTEDLQDAKYHLGQAIQDKKGDEAENLRLFWAIHEELVRRRA